ncbi:MAG: hypothetical protein ABI536_05575 [Gallionella sp.]
MTAIRELDALRKEIEEARKALSAKESALQYLEENAHKFFRSEPVPTNSKSPVEGEFQLEQLVINTARRTLMSEVESVIERFGQQEFTVAHVEAALKKTGVELKDGKSPRPRISTILGKLENSGVVVRTFEGKGSVPNRYRLLQDSSESF